MNIANKLTMIRIVLSIVVLIILLFPFYMIGVTFPKYVINDQLIINSKYVISGFIFMIAALTDFLDGYIARKYEMVTDFGKLMDAVADKILVNGVLIVLAADNFISPIIPVIVILRDSMVNSIKMVAASKGKVVAAINTGKIKTVFLMVGIVLSLFYNLPFELWNLQVADFLLITAAILSLISGLQYFIMNKDLLGTTK
ncbi:MAG: CDP-diacylglycerol--glycerol-3-phosphate 3-phosphatidyltransferase [Bacilli bacterium]